MKVTKQEFELSFMQFCNSIHGKMDAMTFCLSYATLIYGLFCVFYFVSQEMWNVVPLAVAFCLLAGILIYNEKKLANQSARLQWFHAMVMHHADKIIGGINEQV